MAQKPPYCGHFNWEHHGIVVLSSPCRFCRTLNRFRSPFCCCQTAAWVSLHEERCLCRVRRPRRVIRRCKRMKKYSNVGMVHYWLYYWVYHIILEGLNYVLYFSIVSICPNSWLQWMWTCELITHYPGLAQPDVHPLALASGNFILCYAKITIKKIPFLSCFHSTCFP